MKGGEILGQIVDSGIERSRVLVLAGNIDFASSAERIVLAFDFQLINLQLSSPQIQLRCQTIDASFEKVREAPSTSRCPPNLRSRVSIAPSMVIFPAKSSGLAPKQSHEIAKLIDRCGNVAAKIRGKPAGRVRGECGLAA